MPYEIERKIIFSDPSANARGRGERESEITK
jgi:hypothetical protein